MIAFAGVAFGEPRVAAAAAALAAVVVAATARRYAHLTIGTDGVLLRRELGQDSFLPYGAIGALDTKSERIAIRHTLGEPLELWPATGDGASLRADLDAGVAAFLGAECPIALPAISRGASSSDEWLRRLNPGESLFRAAAFPDEVLLDTLRAPRADPTIRLGCAVLLRSRRSPHLSAAIGEALVATANPTLAFALRSVDRGDSNAIVATWAALLPVSVFGRH